jgi:peptide/nickel transport system substrate-binding protein
VSRRRFLGWALGATAAAACGAPSSNSGPLRGATSTSPTSGGPIATLAVEGEPRTLVPVIGGGPGTAAEHLFDLVHQSLVTYDDEARPVPRLARELPSLERGTWRVFDDGTMETVWRLRPDVRWHDGAPFTADDVIFSWRLLNDPALAVSSRRVVRLIESIESPDPLTVVMRWRGRYAFADQLTGFDLAILPSHLLEASYELRREQLSNHPYWRSEFIGLGPYRVQRWPTGSTIELRAFDDYFLGRPSIDTMFVRFIPDDNSAMAAVLSGSVDIVLPRRGVLGIVRSIRDRWSSSQEGVLSIIPGYSWVFLAPQFQGPQPEELMDLRIRQALAHALDRSTIAEVVTGDRLLASDVWVPVGDARYDAIASGLTRYAYSPSRARELFREVGWRQEAADDVLVKGGRRFELELTTTPGLDRAAAVIAEQWRAVGVVVNERVLAANAQSDRQLRATYGGVELAAGSPGLALVDSRLHSTNVPEVSTQFAGMNRGHYVNPQVDSLLDRLWVTLDRSERESLEREVARLMSNDLALDGLFFYPSMTMVRSQIRGTRPPRTAAPTGRLLMTWNAHQWTKA